MGALPEATTSSQQFKRSSLIMRYTRENWERALQVLRMGKSAQAAADAAGCSRATLYLWRGRNEQTHAEWVDACEAGVDRMEDEALRRAVDGVEKPVFGRVSGGEGEGSSMEQIGSTIEYSDSLLQFMLKGKRPKVYRDNVTVSGDPDSPIIHGVKVVFVQGGAPAPQTIEHEKPDEPNE